MLYPMNTILKDEQLKLVETFLSKFGVKSSKDGYKAQVRLHFSERFVYTSRPKGSATNTQQFKHSFLIQISSINASEGIADVAVKYNGKNIVFKTPSGSSTVQR